MTWYADNKERESIKQKAYKSTPEFKQHRREYDKKKHDHFLKLKYQWRLDNPEKYKAQKKKDDKKYRDQIKDTPEFKEKESVRGKKYYNENKEKIAKYSRIHSKLPEVAQRRRELEKIRYEANPEKKHIINIRYLNKLSQPVNMDRFEYQIALMSWTKTVRKHFDNKCQVCFADSDHSHHLFQKQYYPKLALNLNNGIALCLTHHKEIHQWGN